MSEIMPVPRNLVLLPDEHRTFDRGGFADFRMTLDFLGTLGKKEGEI